MSYTPLPLNTARDALKVEQDGSITIDTTIPLDVVVDDSTPINVAVEENVDAISIVQRKMLGALNELITQQRLTNLYLAEMSDLEFTERDL